MNINPGEIGKVIKYEPDPNKASGYDLITGQVIKQLPRKLLVTITQLINAALNLKYFAAQRKIIKFILVHKADKSSSELISHKAISLPPVLANKILETFRNTVTRDDS